MTIFCFFALFFLGVASFLAGMFMANDWLPRNHAERRNRHLGIFATFLAAIGMFTFAGHIGFAWANARFHYLLRTKQEWIGDFRSGSISAMASFAYALAVILTLILIVKTWDWWLKDWTLAAIRKVRADGWTLAFLA